MGFDDLARAAGFASDRQIQRCGGPSRMTLQRIRRGDGARSDVVFRLAAVLGLPASIVELAIAETARHARGRP